MKGNTRQLLSMIFVFTVIAVAYACRILGKFDIGGVYTNYIRSALYLLLFAWWGFTIDRRIIQKQVLHCLRLTALLMLLWLVLRTLKYHVVTGVTAARYVWYLYYLPMLFLPLLGVYIALLLGKPEEYRLPGRARLLAIIPAVLFLLVITNDLHQWAFAFKDGVPGRPVSSAFTHRLLYFVCLVWMVACITFSLVRLFRKSRIPGGAQKRLTPFVLGCVTLLYGLLYEKDAGKAQEAYEGTWKQQGKDSDQLALDMTLVGGERYKSGSTVRISGVFPVQVPMGFEDFAILNIAEATNGELLPFQVPPSTLIYLVPAAG